VKERRSGAEGQQQDPGLPELNLETVEVVSDEAAEAVQGGFLTLTRVFACVARRPGEDKK
jgi:hypothetical protein